MAKRIYSIPLFLLTIFSSVFSITAEGGKPFRFLMLNCNSRILSIPEKKLITDYATSHFSEHYPDYRILTWGDIQPILSREALQQYAGCDNGECFAVIGRSLGAHYLIATDLSILGKTFILSCKLISTADFSVISRVYRHSTWSKGTLLLLLPDLLRELMESAGLCPLSHTQTNADSTDAQMIAIPGGVFQTPYGRDKSRMLTVAIKQFNMDKSEVTIGEYMKCVEAGGCTTPEWISNLDNVTYEYKGWKSRWLNKPLPESALRTVEVDPHAEIVMRKILTDPERDSYPVTGVNRHQAAAYCFWKGKRLPTQMEWLYACRGDEPDKKPDKSTVWHYGNSSLHIQKTGQKKPNSFG